MRISSLYKKNGFMMSDCKAIFIIIKTFHGKMEKKADVTHLWDFNRPSPPSCHVRQTEVWWWSGREMPRNVSRTVSLQQSASRLETGPILSRSRLSDSETPLNGSTLRQPAYSCSAIAIHRKTPKRALLEVFCCYGIDLGASIVRLHQSDLSIWRALDQ